MQSVLIYLAAGACAGFGSGLFGLGGGLVLVPVLLFIFATQGMPETVAMHLAVGSSLASIVVTSASSIGAHTRLGGVLWNILKPMAVGLVIGALLGAQLAGFLSGLILKRIFAVFVLIMAAHMGLGSRRPPVSRGTTSKVGLVRAGLVIGSLSSLVGIGGGSLMVPYLAWRGTEMRKAVGTSAAAGFPIALAGSIGFVIAGWSVQILPSGATGYIYWPAVGGIVVASVVMAPVGAKVAHRLPSQALKRVFALLLLAVGARLLMG